MESDSRSFQRHCHGCFRRWSLGRSDLQDDRGSRAGRGNDGNHRTVRFAREWTMLSATLPHRSDDLNMRSTWLCSRNDIIANISVLVAAIGVKLLNASWPDILIGAAIAALFLRSAFTVLSASF